MRNITFKNTKILSISSTQIQEKEETKSIRETILPLVNGATANVWTRPNNIRTQGARKIVLQEQESKYGRLLQHRTIRPHRAINKDRQTYIRVSTEYRTARLDEHQNRVTAAGNQHNSSNNSNNNRYTTVDISGEFLYCDTHANNLGPRPREETRFQRQARIGRKYYCYTHGYQRHQEHNGGQCRNCSVRR